MSDTLSPSPAPSGLMAALMDPGVQTLAGMAQGFAQAAMPTRMPTPWGAVIGMGAGGAMQGATNAQRMALTQNQIRAGQMQNQVTQAQLPLELARSQMMTSAFQNPNLLGSIYGAGGAPFGAPGGAAPTTGAPAPVTPIVAPAAGGASPYGKATSAALLSLPDDATRTMAINAALTSNLPQEAWAPWMATLHNESGWNLKAPDNKNDNGTIDVGPGQVNSSNWAHLGLTEAQARDPATNLNASARLFGQNWQSAAGDPTKAIQAYNPGDPGYVAKVAPRLGTWGYPGASAPSAASTVTPENALTTSNQYLAMANDLDRRQAQAKALGLPAPAGDPAALRTAAQQYRAVALAGPTAGATANAELPATLAKYGFTLGANGQMVPIAGGPADPAYVGKAEAAKATAQAAADRTKLITTRAGVFDPVSGREVYRQPEYHELQDPNSGKEYPAFIQPGEDGKINIQGGPPGVTGETPPSKLGPGQEDIIKHLADQYANQDKLKYEGATNSLFQLDQQDRNIATLNSGGGWSSTGTGANAKLEWAKAANSAFQTLGITPVMDPQKVASWEDASKVQTQLAFAQAKQLGSREAQQVIQMSRVATPGAENTPQGYGAISAGYHEMNNREVDLYNYKTNWAQTHGGNLMGAETAFNNQFTPEMYGHRAISTVLPIKISSDADLGKYLPGTIVIAPNGNKVMVPMRAGSPSVPGYLTANMPNAQP